MNLLAWFDLAFLVLALGLAVAAVLTWPSSERRVGATVRRAPARAREAARDFTTFGDPLFLITLGVVLAAFGFQAGLFTQRQAMGVVLVPLVAVAVARLWKRLSGREDARLGSKTEGTRFPSGHALAAAAVTTVVARAAIQAGLFSGSVLVAGLVAIKLIILARLLVAGRYIEGVTAGAATGIVIAVLIPRLLALA